MTTPGQKAPDGAYVIGGGAFRFGQALKEDAVQSLMMAGLNTLRLGSIADGATAIENLLHKIPLDALKMAKPFIAGATDADFADQDAAVATIMRALHIKEVFATLGQVQNLIDTLIRAIVKIFTGLDGGLDVLEKWWNDLMRLIGSGPAGLLAFLQDIINRIWSFITGIVTHPDKTFADIVDVLENWFQVTFQNVWDGLNDVITAVQDLLDGIWGLLTGVTGDFGKTAAEVVDAIKGWLSGPFKAVQDGVTAVTALVRQLLDGLSGVVGGTVAQAVAVITGLATKIQQLVDAIAGVFNPGKPTGNAIADVIAAVTGILGVGQTAQIAADHANMGVAAIRAEQKAGFYDDFNYDAGTSMPAPWQTRLTLGSIPPWVPNGAGFVVLSSAVTMGNHGAIYKRTDKPLAGPTGTVTLVLSKPPHSDLFVNSFAYVCAQMSAVDQSGIRWKLGAKTAQLETLNAAGTASTVGASVAIPELKAGDSIELRYDATAVKLVINSRELAGRPYTQLAGRGVGFGGLVPAYTWLTGHPAPEFTGLAWHP